MSCAPATVNKPATNIDGAFPGHDFSAHVDADRAGNTCTAPQIACSVPGAFAGPVEAAHSKTLLIDSRKADPLAASGPITQAQSTLGDVSSSTTSGRDRSLGTPSLTKVGETAPPVVTTPIPAALSSNKLSDEVVTLGTPKGSDPLR